MLRAFIVVLAALVLGLGAWLAAGRSTLREPGGEAPAPRPTLDAPPPPAPGTSAPDAAAPPRPSAPARGRQLSMDEAMKALDLIRPARTKSAEAFTVPLLGGGTFKLADQRGKLVFVNFWATWCPPCLEEMPAMERLWREHKDEAFVMVAISLDSDVKLVPPFVAEHKLTFAVGLDPALDVANVYGIRALPATFLIDRQGNLAALALGPRAWDNVAAHSLLAGLTRN